MYIPPTLSGAGFACPLANTSRSGKRAPHAMVAGMSADIGSSFQKSPGFSSLDPHSAVARLDEHVEAVDDEAERDGAEDVRAVRLLLQRAERAAQAARLFGA